MLKYLLLIILFISSGISYSSIHPSYINHTKIHIQSESSSFKEVNTKKLNWKERIIQKKIQKNCKPKEKFKWHWGGFFLGMLVPIGFIITLLIKDEKRKSRILTAFISTIITLLAVVLIIAVIDVSNL